mgnify:CR=1 FL=1
MRRRILRRITEDSAISPRELADALKLPLSNVSYHVRVLAESSVVTLVGTKPVRGSMQHFYRRRPLAPWALQVLDGDEKDEDGEDDARGESRGRPPT